MELSEVLDFVGEFLSRFAAFAVLLTAFWGLFSIFLTTDVRVLRLAARRNPGAAVRILRRVHRAYSKRPRAALVDDVVLAALAAMLACFSALLMLRILVVREHGSLLLVLLAVYLAHVLGPTGLLRAYGWLGGRESRFGFLPPPIPGTSGWTTPSKRREIAANLYRVRLHYHLMLAALGGATFIYLTKASADPGVAELVGFVVSLLLAFGIVELTAVLHRRLTGRLHVVGLIAAVLKPRRTSKQQPELTVEQSRSQIAAIAAATERYAHHLHHKQNRHPNAHLLGLEVALLRAYLATFDSLTLDRPTEITRSLRRITAVLIGGKHDFLRATQDQLAYLVDDVSPAPARRAWTARLSDAVDLTDRTTKVVGLLIGLGTFVLLVRANRASIQDLAPWLPWG
ncbi:hypothetical protein [Promicromonospora sp. NFX87]|uniref:hypothetical protein n=1 Tax=Promicromonospora sp. NFX87 TaxID=3402691 RepID=UPI003AFAB709